MLKHLKRCLSYIICLAMILGIFSLIPTPLSATSRLTLTDSGAWFETAYAQWSNPNCVHMVLLAIMSTTN